MGLAVESLRRRYVSSRALISTFQGGARSEWSSGCSMTSTFTYRTLVLGCDAVVPRCGRETSQGPRAGPHRCFYQVGKEKGPLMLGL
jgi:hypothetical protein